MNKELRILYIEDNADEREGLKEVLSGQKVNGHTMIIDCEPSFDKAIEKSRNYHIVILVAIRTYSAVITFVAINIPCHHPSPPFK